MKRTITIFTIVLFTLLLLFSCKAEESTATLRVNIDRGKRTISPSASQLNIQTFSIYTTGPDGKSGIQKTIYSDSTTIEGLKIGEWTIRVEGKNNEGTVLATGENKIMLSTANNVVEVSLTELYGKGNLDISFKWDNKRITGTKLTASLKPQSGENTIDISDKLIKDSDYTYSLQMQGLNAGSYVMTGSLYSNNEKVGGFTEAIRISNGVTTSGTISLGLDKIINTDIGFSNLTSVPIECKIEGITSLLPSRENLNASLKITTNNISESSLNSEWFLDGVSVGEGRTVSIKPEPGDHRLDVVVSTEHSGSVGSASVTFTAANLFKGLPYRLNIYKGDDNLMLSGKTVVRIVPDGDALKTNNIMVISRDKKYLQTLIMGENSYRISQSQSLTDPSWGYKYEVADVVFEGTPRNGTVNAALICDGPQITTYQFNTNSVLLNNRSIVTTGASSTQASTVTNYGYGAYLSESKYLMTHGYNPEVFSHGFLILNTVAGETSGDWTNYVVYNLNSFPNKKVSGTVYAGQCSFTETNGKDRVVFAVGSGIIHLKADLKPDTSSPGKMKTVLSNMGIENVGGTISGVAAVGGDYALVLVKPTPRSSEIRVYGWPTKGYYLENKSTYGRVDMNYKLLKYSPATDILYTLDENTNQLVALTFNPATLSFSTVGAVTLPDVNYSRMDISDDGTMIVLYDDLNADRIAVLNVKVTN